MNQQVKITAKGKVIMHLSDSLKHYFKNFLELLMNDRAKTALTIISAKDHCYTALVSELYSKYLAQLSFVTGDTRVALTLAQAYALWELSQDYEHFAFAHPQMGNLLMELHQKLS